MLLMAGFQYVERLRREIFFSKHRDILVPSDHVHTTGMIQGSSFPWGLESPFLLTLVPQGVPFDSCPLCLP